MNATKILWGHMPVVSAVTLAFGKGKADGFGRAIATCKADDGTTP
jgi:hypothetical protein